MFKCIMLGEKNNIGISKNVNKKSLINLLVDILLIILHESKSIKGYPVILGIINAFRFGKKFKFNL